MKTKQTFKHSTSLETCGTNETTAYGAHLFHIENISNRSIVGRSRPSKPAVLSSKAAEDGRFGGSPDAGAAVAGAAAAIGRYVCIPFFVSLPFGTALAPLVVLFWYPACLVRTLVY
jgi:hypothetical protein